jgi:phosphatidylglycerophosphate synthase
MIDNVVREQLPRFAGPLLALYTRLGWTPNHVSVLGLVIALAASGSVALGHGWVALGLWWVSRLADGTDGLFARHSGQQSDFGAYLDIVLDMASYGAMVLGFAVAAPDFYVQWMAMLFLYILCITSALALGAEETRLGLAPRDDRGLRLGAGLAEGGETGIAYSVFLLFPEQMAVTTTLWVIVLATTVVARTALAMRSLAPPSPAEPPPALPTWGAPRSRGEPTAMEEDSREV